MGQLLVYTLALNLIMRIDLFLLKRFAARLASDGTLAADAPAAQSAAELASTCAAYYGTAQSLAFIPYQAILSLAFVIFPLISRSTFEQNADATQAYIRQTLRLSLVFVAGVAVVFIANPAATINVPYTAQYRIGAPALQILSGGMICLSLFTIINTILNGAGRAGLAIISGIATLIAAVVANAVVVPRAPSWEAALTLAAWCTALAMAGGLLLSVALLYRAFRATFPVLSVVRVLGAMAVAIVLGYLIPEVSKVVTLGEDLLLFIVYFLVLVALREFSAEDRKKLGRILGIR
jgi:O-antigen/teichoic acid export membrane protein